MTDKKPLKFDSGKFPKDEFGDKERAEMRERHYHYDNHYISVDDLVDMAGLRWLSNIAKGFPEFIKFFIALVVIGGGIKAAQGMGLL